MYDGPSKIKYYPDGWRIEVLKKLIADGFVEQLFISNDMGRKSYLKAYGGGPGWEYVHTKCIPRLKKNGITEEEIEQIFIANPREFLSWH